MIKCQNPDKICNYILMKIFKNFGILFPSGISQYLPCIKNICLVKNLSTLFNYCNHDTNLRTSYLQNIIIGEIINYLHEINGDLHLLSVQKLL